VDVALLYSRFQVGHFIIDGIQFKFNDINNDWNTIIAIQNSLMAAHYCFISLTHGRHDSK